MIQMNEDYVKIAGLDLLIGRPTTDFKFHLFKQPVPIAICGKVFSNPGIIFSKANMDYFFNFQKTICEDCLAMGLKKAMPEIKNLKNFHLKKLKELSPIIRVSSDILIKSLMESALIQDRLKLDGHFDGIGYIAVSALRYHLADQYTPEQKKILDSLAHDLFKEMKNKKED